MKIYVSHSSGYDYQNELYTPLKESIADVHEFILPHEEHAEGFKTRDIIPTCDLVLADVSFPSTGQGIEIGWADAATVRIVCMYASGSTVSSALRFVAEDVFEYKDTMDMIEKVRMILAENDV